MNPQVPGLQVTPRQGERELGTQASTPYPAPPPGLLFLWPGLSYRDNSPAVLRHLPVGLGWAGQGQKRAENPRSPRKMLPAPAPLLTGHLACSSTRCP